MTGVFIAFLLNIAPLLGSVGSVFCEPAGESVSTAAYEAFGTHESETGADLDRQQANTKEEDPTGLLNEGFRYRDLETGIFISRDPAGFVDGPNVYTYVRQNPWTMLDPLGLKKVTNYHYYVDRENNEPMVLQLASGEEAAITSIEASIPEQQAKICNFEVRDLHNYFVGESRMLVHNGEPPSPAQLLGLEFANNSARESAEAITLGQMNKAKTKRVSGVDRVGIHGEMFQNPGVKPHAHGVDHKGNPWSVNIDGTPHDAGTKKGSIPKKLENHFGRLAGVADDVR